jgi:hypothetical protein
MKEDVRIVGTSSNLMIHPLHPQDWRMTNSVARTSRDLTSSPRMTFTSCCTACLPTCSVGARTVVSGGKRVFANNESSNPTILISSGTRIPASRKALRTPIADSSSPVKTASILIPAAINCSREVRAISRSKFPRRISAGSN